MKSNLAHKYLISFHDIPMMEDCKIVIKSKVMVIENHIRNRYKKEAHLLGKSLKLLECWFQIERKNVLDNQ